MKRDFSRHFYVYGIVIFVLFVLFFYDAIKKMEFLFDLLFGV